MGAAAGTVSVVKGGIKEAVLHVKLTHPSFTDLDITNSHLEYFESYFQKLKPPVKSIVIEYNYIDHDYMVDYAKFYSRSYSGYERFCSRLHFFSDDITVRDIELAALILDQEEISHSRAAIKKLQESYQGFVVLRPLRKSFFGKACIQTYGSSGARGIRSFPLKAPHSAHLAGIPLCIESGVAWQEQDRVVAACATSALWSAFQCTGRVFHHSIPSPSEITASALHLDSFLDNVYQSDGLTQDQMVQAIQSRGLVPLTIRPAHGRDLQMYVHTVLRASIPIVMLMEKMVKRNSRDFNFTKSDYGKEREFNISGKKIKYLPVARHAVTITGYGTSNTVSEKNRRTERSRFEHSKIDRIYVHDDAVGPFAAMTFATPEQETCALTMNEMHPDVILRPFRCLIPLDHKIRLRPLEVLEIILSFAGAFRFLTVNRRKNKVQPDLKWDFFLKKAIDVKEDIRNNDKLWSINNRKFILDSSPKYLWNVTCSCSKTGFHMRLLLDGTDCYSGNVLHHILDIDKAFFSSCQDVLFDPEFHQIIEPEPSWHIFKAILSTMESDEVED